MPNVTPSKIVCFTCRKPHLNVTHQGAENLRKMGLSEPEIAVMMTAGDSAGLRQHPGRHRIIGPGDIPRLLSLGLSAEEVAEIQQESMERATRDYDAEIPVVEYDEAIPDAALDSLTGLDAESAQLLFSEAIEKFNKIATERHADPEARRVKQREQARIRKQRQRSREKSPGGLDVSRPESQ